jgi:hypothetical protein
MRTNASTIPRAGRGAGLALLLALLPGAAFAQPGEVPQPLEAVAQLLQQKLPAVAIDHLFEAERLSTGWTYRLQVAQQKNWVDEVIIMLKRKTATSCEYTVKVSRIEGGPFGSKREIQPAAGEVWTAKVGQLLGEGTAPTATP